VRRHRAAGATGELAVALREVSSSQRPSCREGPVRQIAPARSGLEAQVFPVSPLALRPFISLHKSAYKSSDLRHRLTMPVVRNSFGVISTLRVFKVAALCGTGTSFKPSVACLLLYIYDRCSQHRLNILGFISMSVALNID